MATFESFEEPTKDKSADIAEYLKIRTEALARYTKAMEEAKAQYIQELDKSKVIRDHGDVEAWGKYVRTGGQAMYDYQQTRENLRTRCKVAQDGAQMKLKRLLDEEWAKFEKVRDEALSRYNLSLDQHAEEMIRNDLR